MSENLPNNNLNNSPTPTPAPMPQENVAANPVVTQTNFLNGTETVQKDALYADLFQQNGSGDTKEKEVAKRSPLEIVKMVMSVVMPITIVLALGAGVYATIKGQEDNSMAENFPFLCGILTSGIQTDNPSYECQAAAFIQSDQEQKKAQLEKIIVEQLALYLPLKIASTITEETASGATTLAESTAEGVFAKKIFSEKVNANEIIAQFEKIRKSAQSPNLANIVCNQIELAQGSNLTVHCDVYGGEIGAIDTRALGSSRIEAIRFIERLSDAQSSRFLLETPPTTLSVEEIDKEDPYASYYKTKTTVVLTMKYLPLQTQI